MTTTILALDLGKFNSVLCWYESEDRPPAFRSVKSRRNCSASNSCGSR